MSRFIKKKKEDIGLSPYALVFRGLKKTDKISLHAMNFDLDQVREYEIKSDDQLLELKNTKNVSWLNVDGLHDVSRMEGLADIFEIPVNIISDIMNPSLRPKVQEFDNGFFTTIKILQYNESTEQLSVENLSLIIINHVLISFQEQETSLFDPVRERIR